MLLGDAKRQLESAEAFKWRVFPYEKRVT
jgi:hypothetical protein